VRFAPSSEDARVSSGDAAYLTPEGRARVEVDRITLKQNPLRAEHLRDFVSAFAARAESERFRRFTYDELVARDKASLDLTWLKDDSLEDTENLPPPEVIAQEIVEDLEAALAQFGAVADSLAKRSES
jgi:type I restriction enzyme M protein